MLEEIDLVKSVSCLIEYQKWLPKMQTRLSKRLHSFLSRLPLCALKLKILGLTLISVLLNLFKEFPNLS
ncbi:unnamed protein product [Hymenolepis diminuta]|uniref:Uncharacterized protein n=1 Tax=Hymenolepis diminuta TaxID=6216 RepID=A0A564ZFS5_HYMDI|nr:unnamed protein product [Hymenolepis diminuta]